MGKTKQEQNFCPISKVANNTDHTTLPLPFSLKSLLFCLVSLRILVIDLLNKQLEHFPGSLRLSSAPNLSQILALKHPAKSK
jgi:hypothetical protein